ncbi:CXXC motif containing zinc binding protein isoform X3 [Paramormyrops kingsleyae]|nr:UPF0587 protein C1orf123 homolog isoform X3 [Paramormyrops kingsleyae]
MPLKGGRGSASMVQKCKLCSRDNSIGMGHFAISQCPLLNQTTSTVIKNTQTHDILKDTITSYNAEDSDRFKTMVQFECRGLEPVDFQPQAGFSAQGAESGTPFPEINLLERDWNDYDEKISESVGIYEVTHKFVKC